MASEAGGALLPEIETAAAPLAESELRRRARARARFDTLAKVAIVLLLAVQLALELLSTRGMTATYDEYGHWRYGDQLLHGDATRFDDSKMPVTALNALGWDVMRALPAGRWKDVARRDFLAARLPTMLASLLLTALVARWSWRLWGARGALLSTLLAVFDPNLLAHARLVTTDLYAALAFTAVFYLAWRCAERPTTKGAAAVLLAIGVAQVVKYSAVLLPVLLLPIVLVRYGTGHRRPGERLWPRLRRLARRSLVWLGGALVAVLLVVNAAFLFQRTLTRFGDYHFRSAVLREAQARWPQLARVPVPVPYSWLEGLDWVEYRERTGDGYGRIYLRGELRDGRGFTGYYLWAWLYKVPLPSLLLIAVAVVVAVRRRRSLRWRRDLVFLLVPPLLLAIHLNFFFRAQMGIRYSLMIFPPLYVLCGLLAVPASGRRLSRGATVALLAAGAWLVASVLSWHPFYLEYFSDVVRDRKQAWRLLADSNLDWGQNDGRLARWRARHPDAIVKPERPTTGTVVVGANDLTGVARDAHDEWLRGLDPVGTIGYSYLIFQVRPEDLARAGVRAAPPAAASPRPSPVLSGRSRGSSGPAASRGRSRPHGGARARGRAASRPGAGA